MRGSTRQGGNDGQLGRDQSRDVEVWRPLNHQIGSESVVREQGRAAVQWQTACGADDALRRRIARLSEDPLPLIHGVSRSRRGTGRPGIVCREVIAATDVEREVGVGMIMHAHEACYKLWREESKRDASPRRPAS
jgi:hypothetical protein